MSEGLRAAANRFENWITQDAIPLWLSRGINPANGVHYERLLPSGEVDYESTLRLRVQARQIFFFAAAAHYGWCNQGTEVAQRINDFVLQHARHPSAEGGYVHLLNKQCEITDSKQDLYDHAFFLLAYAWLYKVTGDTRSILEAENLFTYLDTHFASPFGGWIEGDYPYSCRRQNPHMHLFEAFLALYDATQDDTWLARATRVFELFQTHFYDANLQVLFEFYEEDWQHCKDERGQVVEPGHLMEWVWLLDWYGRCSGQDVRHITRALYTKGLAIGLDRSGMLFDAIAADGRVLDSRKRCWPMTEFIKASLVQARAGHAEAEAIAIKAVNDLFDYFLCAPTAGAYIDQRDADNKILIDMAPASTLYHLIGAAMELVDHCKLVD